MEKKKKDWTIAKGSRFKINYLIIEIKFVAKHIYHIAGNNTAHVLYF